MNNILNSLIAGAKRLLYASLFLLPLILYSVGSETSMDSMLQTPANGLVSSGYDYYPAYLDDEVVIHRKAFVDENGEEYYGAVIEVRRPVILAAPEDTGSMQPLFGAGNMLVQEVVDENTELQKGDIIVYEHDNALIIHQIVGEEKGCYVTKGINNRFPDPDCVTKEKIRYRLLFAIPTK